MAALTRALLRLTRWWARRLTTEASQVSRWQRGARAALFVPMFALAYFCARLQNALFANPITMTAPTRFGCRIECRMPDMIQLYLYLFGIWEPDTTALIQQRMAAGGVFVDVGANIGAHSLLAPSAQVVAIEASPITYERMLNNVARARDHRVRAVLAAAGPKGQRATLHPGPAHNVGLATTLASRGFAAGFDVELLPLDEILTAEELASTRLVKIDIEGAEPSLLASLGDFLARCRDDVEFIIELSPSWWEDPHLKIADALAPLTNQGFKVYRYENNLWPWRYLYPNAIAPLERLDPLPMQRVKRLDLLLTRREL